MAARANTIAQAFSKKLQLEVYDNDIFSMITNRDYEGEINAVGSKLNMLNFDRISEKTYDGSSDLTPDNLTENNTVLVINQYKSFYWTEKTIENWLSYIKDPHPTIVTQTASERNKNIDTYILGFYGDVGAGNRVGTNESTGTVTVTITSGAVVGNGTAFTAAMVGKGFKADGHSTWYRIASRSSSTAIVIEDDLDDVTTQYTGGAIAGSSTYVIESATAVAITTANLLQYVAALKQKLDEAEKYGNNAVPDSDRYLIVPPEFANLLNRASGIALHVPEVYTELIKRGAIGQLLGFNVVISNRLTGNNSTGYHCLALQTGWMTFAEKVLTARMEEDIVANFGQRYKDLFVYGAKVPDAKRHYAAEGLFTFTGAA
jgi:hypothetical protein